MIFDVKIDFTRKARLVAGGHLTDPPTTLTYSSVVSRESVRLAFLIAALNDLNILVADIGNAYINTMTKEKVYTTAGKEFGDCAGQTIIITRALYGLKSSGAAWRSHLAKTLGDMIFKSSYADPDVWMRVAYKEDETSFHEYVLCYVDDLLCISADPAAILGCVEQTYQLKEKPCKPECFLGATIKEFYFQGNENPRWAMLSNEYIKNAIKTVETELAKWDKKLSTKAITPLASGYWPELDVSHYLDDDRTNYYQSLIGILCWAVELGRIDINVHTAMMSSFMAQPCVVHFEQVLHIFAYLKYHDCSTLVFEEIKPTFKESAFNQCDWSEFYPEAQEAISLNMPEPKGNSVNITVFVDADHAGNRTTRCFFTGILIYGNRAPIIWYSKKQNTVETSIFGSEFVAMKIATEITECLLY